jgi:hypothetical protein
VSTEYVVLQWMPLLPGSLVYVALLNTRESRQREHVVEQLHSDVAIASIASAHQRACGHVAYSYVSAACGPNLKKEGMLTLWKWRVVYTGWFYINLDASSHLRKVDSAA